MKRWFVGLSAAAMAWLFVAPTAAQTVPALVTNGCGSGRIAFLVPDNTMLSSCKFKNACDRHDICYGRCLPGGNLAGNSTCGVVEAKALRRQTCDTAMQRDIIADNAGKSVCSLYASVYRFAVQLMGEQYFRGLAGTPTAVGQLNDFLAYLNKNPDAFDAASLEKAFVSVADRGLEGVDYEFLLFHRNPPLLVARHDDQELFQVLGRRKAP